VTSPPRIVTLLLFLMVIAIPLFGSCGSPRDLAGPASSTWRRRGRAENERGRDCCTCASSCWSRLWAFFALWGALIDIVRRVFMGQLVPALGRHGVLISALYYDPIVLVAGIRQLPYLSLIFVLYSLRRHTDEVQRLFVGRHCGGRIAECAVAVIQVFIFLPATNLPILSIPRLWHVQ